MRNGLTIVIVVSVVHASHIVAQAPLAFDAVSIKPNTSREQCGASRAMPGRYQGTNVTLMRLIGLAYRPIQEFEGGPDWIRADRFDVDATAGGPATPDQMQAMLRTMLAERFALQVRQETRQRPVYALTLARTDGRLGDQLEPSDASCPDGPGTCGVWMADDSLSSRGITMARLARELSFVGRKVIDRTALAGAFDVNLQWAPDTPAAAPATGSDLPAIVTALQEQLGLKLEPTMGPVDVVVILGAERPTAN
jgi:uncharacterized protein (TIGR03435 family)